MQKHDQDFLKNLTIVLPTYERQDYLIRFLNYWSDKQVQIIVMDGSKRSLHYDIIKNLSKNIKYLHLPKSYYERMFEAIDLIDTEFVMQACDDEFYIPSALNSSIEKLIKNPDLVTCGGNCMGFDYTNGSVIGFKRYEKLKDLRLFISDPNERIKKHFSNYVPAHIYSISRSKIWKIASKTVYSKEYSFFGALELQLEFLLLYGGKTLIIPELMWLRSNENKSIHNDTPSFAPTNTFRKWWISDKFLNEKQDFILRMEQACKQIDKVNYLNNEPKIKNVFKKFLYFNKHGYIGLTWLFFQPVFRYIPSLKKLIKVFFNTLGYRNLSTKNLFEMVNEYLKENVKVDINELSKIKDKIIDFHSKKKN